MFCMDQRLKKWEAALIFGVLFALLCGVWLDGEQKALGEQVVRLHVIANSDSERDQALKLAVRDRVLDTAETLYPPQTTRAESLEILSQNLPLLEEKGQLVVEEWGECYPVRAELTECWFPTKYYDEFALPAGEYTALRVVIGEGAGQNWWCVAFPPLCLGAASETVEDAVASGSFTPEQGALMTGESGGYVLKFKSMELLGQLKHWLQ